MEAKTVNHKNVYYPPGGILMWIVIFLELITFGMGLITMVFYSKQEVEIFHNSRLLLNTFYGAVNTVFLLTSGFFIALSVMWFKKSNLKLTKLYLKLALLGGVFFLGIKSIEYYDKIEAGLTIGYNTFFTFYWMLTLFHVIHVLVGLVILGSVFFGLTKENSTTSIEGFEASAAFWHMCDLIWLLLFPIIYLIF